MNKQLITSVLREKGLINSKNVHFEPLPGGVSSDIYVLTAGTDKYVIKQALPKLQVEDDWYADPSRNETEQEFIEYVQQFLPDAVPNILLRDADQGFFIMEFLDPSFENWKEQLLGGKFNPGTAETAAELLAAIHLHSWQDEQAKETFNTTSNFKSLRIEPYLITTGNRHPDLKSAFHDEAKRLEHQREALVHGDFSPKNIMVNPDRMVLLDHEVAWFGDPAFDVAFLLNHLYLKMLFHHKSAGKLPDLTQIVSNTYSKKIGETKEKAIKPRIGRLLLMLMLARVDGKSPVEYLQEAQKNFIRSFVHDLLPKRVYALTAINTEWKSKLTTYSFEN